MADAHHRPTSTNTMTTTIETETDASTATSAQVTPALVQKREMEFDSWVKDLPKHFAVDGDIVMSHILAVLSSVFPDGEDYFVHSVQAAQDKVSDPRLAADVEGFIGQESMHGREHRVLNDRLADLGYPTHAIGWYVRALMGTRERLLSNKVNLGFTAALEHYTATLAETILRDPEARREVGHRGIRDLLTWHALEESEHKAVAFDVFRTVGGSEATRQTTMWVTHLTFVLETGIWTAISLALDPDARRHPLKVARSLWRLRRSPFAGPRATRQLFEYHRRGFHPNDRDTAELISQWRERLFGTEGQLTELRAS